jgi:hypothetical protein
MSRLEHCYENAITAIEDGKDYDTWRYEEIPRLNASPFNHDWAVLTDDSIIGLRDIWELAMYAVCTYKQSLGGAGHD